MNNRGSGLLLVVLVVVVLAALAAFFFVMGKPTQSSGAPGVPSRSIAFAVSFAKSPAGVTAVLTVTNSGTEDLKEVRITKAALASMNGTTGLPMVITPLYRNGIATFTLPFTGTPPPSNSPLSLILEYEYRFGWFGKGKGSSGVTSILR